MVAEVRGGRDGKTLKNGKMGKDSCQALLFYSLSLQKGAGNMGQEQAVWKMKVGKTDYLCNASEGAEIFQGAQTRLWDKVEKWGQREFSKVKREMAMTEDGCLSYFPSCPQHRAWH